MPIPVNFDKTVSQMEEFNNNNGFHFVNASLFKINKLLQKYLDVLGIERVIFL
jgi:hypothetical protein